MLAKQIATYRGVTDRNFERSVMIDTQAQLLISNFKVHQAQSESFKRLSQTHLSQVEKGLIQKTGKYQELAARQEDIDDLLRGNMDEIYGNFDERLTRDGGSLELEINAIMRQALDPTLQSKFYRPVPGNSSPDREDLVFLNVRIHNPHPVSDSVKTGGQPVNEGATVIIPTLDMSIDMLKRQISQDVFAIKQLKIGYHSNKPFFNAALGNVQPFKIGRLEEVEGSKSLLSKGDPTPKLKFVPFDFTESLKSLDIENGDTIWILMTG